MSMPLERRLQVLIDEDRHRRLAELADARGVSVATIVREAIDRGLTNPDDQRRAAGARILAADAIDVPEPAALRDELDALRGRRG
jgi:predicted DNA-binding protein